MGELTNKRWLDELRLGGALSYASVHGREVLYEGRYGTVVERFRDDEGSYIYKPIGDPTTIGRELWVQREIVPALSQLRIPRIVASSATDIEGNGSVVASWLIYEDLGPLNHAHTADGLIKAAGWITQWHRLPLELVPATFAGHTPKLRDVVASLSTASLQDIARWLDMDAAELENWQPWMQGGVTRIGDFEVVSHGDFHPYNIAIQHGDQIVLDWEYVHRNHPCWDLYCLLDITSYRYAKVKLTQEQREAALSSYWDRMELALIMQEDRMKPATSFEDICARYNLFATIYSAWIAGLIEGDLRRGDIPREALIRQRQETIEVFADCLQALRAVGFEEK